MAEDLQANFATYKLQLQQVETSLTTDPDNEDLQKLRKDLQEVIDLTADLIAQSNAAGGAVPSEEGGDGDSESTAATPSTTVPTSHWKVGDKCIAVWSEDGCSYTAAIDEILDDGTCTVTFEEYGNTDVTQVSQLKSVDESFDSSMGAGGGSSKPPTKKDLLAKQREYKKKKAEKKRTRLKALEEERVVEKNKWVSFNAKAFSKTNKGKVKKSIFATPDHVNGRVGVGTCGLSGRPMTKFNQQEKWKK